MAVRSVGGRVIVVGSVNVDLVVSTERLPSPGQTVTGGVFARHHGGKGANQAVAAARLGAPTTFVGAIGDDPFGLDARATLERDGIDLSFVRVDPAEPTGVALILVDGRGENLIAVASGANGTISAAEVARALEQLAPSRGDVVLVGCEIPVAAVRQALRHASATGATTILNPAPADGLDRSVFGLADVLTPNRGELGTLVAAESHRLGRSDRSATPERAAATLLDRNAEGAGVRQAILVSLGAGGAVLVVPSGPTELPAAPVEAIDTVGAGDALNGALAASLAAGMTVHDAARRSVIAAGMAVTARGAREGMPSAAALEAFEARLTEGP